MRQLFIFLYFQSLLTWNPWACYHFCWKCLFPKRCSQLPFPTWEILPSQAATPMSTSSGGLPLLQSGYPLLLPIAWPTLLQALCMVNLSICVYGSIFPMKCERHLKITSWHLMNLCIPSTWHSVSTVGAPKWCWVNTKVDTASAEGWKSITRMSVCANARRKVTYTTFYKDVI